jgi:hypothetical protein
MHKDPDGGARGKGYLKAKNLTGTLNLSGFFLEMKTTLSKPLPL